MRHIFKLVILFLLIFFSASFSNTAFAQYNGVGSLFDLKQPALEKKILKSEIDKADVKLTLLPATNIIIAKGSLLDDTDIKIYKGKWNTLKTLLPKGHSPISSYYIVMKDSSGNGVSPSAPIRIGVYNNFAATDTFFYPLTDEARIGVADSLFFKGNVLISPFLPPWSSAYIVSVDKDLSENDPGLAPTVTSSSNSSGSQAPLSQNLSQAIFFIFPLLIILGVISLIIYKKNK